MSSFNMSHKAFRVKVCFNLNSILIENENFSFDSTFDAEFINYIHCLKMLYLAQHRFERVINVFVEITSAD